MPKSKPIYSARGSHGPTGARMPRPGKQTARPGGNKKVKW
jgi:hypothetical protein